VDLFFIYLNKFSKYNEFIPSISFCFNEYLDLHSSLIFLIFFWLLLTIFLFIYINNYQFIKLDTCIKFLIYTLNFFNIKKHIKIASIPHICFFFLKLKHPTERESNLRYIDYDARHYQTTYSSGTFT
jgi:hypothetical protein